MSTTNRPALARSARSENRSPARTRTRSPSSRARGRPRIVPATEPRSLLALATFGSAVAGAAAYGARFNPSQPGTRRWYRSLEKPPFNPPDAVFAPVWTVLYALMALSAWRVWRRPHGRKRSAALALWGGQLLVNAMWSRIFFGERRPKAALADIAALLATIGGYTAVTRDVDRPAAAMMAPYIAWVSFAALLNEEIVRRNS